jgi:hypothetical protein
MTQPSPVRQALRRVHWSKETSRFGFVLPWPKDRINRIYPWVIDTMVKTIIRRWCRHIGRNSFTSLWQIVIAIRQHCNLHRPTILPSTTKVSVPITEIAVDIVSQHGTRQAKQSNCCEQLFHLVTDKPSTNGYRRFEGA